MAKYEVVHMRKMQTYLENEKFFQEEKLPWRLLCYSIWVLNISHCCIFFYRVNKTLIYICCKLKSRNWAFLAYHNYLNICPVQLSKIKEICWKVREVLGIQQKGYIYTTKAWKMKLKNISSSERFKRHCQFINR